MICGIELHIVNRHDPRRSHIRRVSLAGDLNDGKADRDDVREPLRALAQVFMGGTLDG